MAKVHPGATLTPHFRDFLPPWIARQPWYIGSGIPQLRPVGYFRFEDPAGQVGIETHLVTADSVLYQIPMTYRDAPLGTDKSGALITTADHSVLGTRWIYDGEADPIWISQLLTLIRGNAKSDPSDKRGVGPAEARGRLLTSSQDLDEPRIDLVRVVVAGNCPDDPTVAGTVMGTWHPAGPDEVAATGCLAVVRAVPWTGHRPLQADLTTPGSHEALQDS
jgi:Maltokinase N-terminal cap domain